VNFEHYVSLAFADFICGSFFWHSKEKADSQIIAKMVFFSEKCEILYNNIHFFLIFDYLYYYSSIFRL